MERRIKDYAVLTLKGMAMGAADVVPGVSGGTIAFIAGIYDELINSIKSINMHSLKLLFTGKIAAFWKAVNGNFLFALLLGIAISVFSLAKLITYLLLNEPVLVWSFFFGLVLASTWFVTKDIKGWNWKTVAGFVGGAVIAYYITVATPAETSTIDDCNRRWVFRLKYHSIYSFAFCPTALSSFSASALWPNASQASASSSEWP